MGERKRFFLLVFIMAAATLTVAGVAVFTLYKAAFQEERSRLVETAQSQARLIEAVARFDAKYSRDYPGGPEEATLAQIVDAHEHYVGFGETGEFTLAKRVGDHIVFLLRHRHFDLDRPKPVPYDSDLAEPMRKALSGKSGTLVGLDYRGVLVLAAHEPVGLAGQGIVAKIDLSEIRAPFVRAGAVAAIFSLLVVTVGTGLFLRVSNPIIRRLEEHSQQLEERVEERTEELRQLSAKLLHAHEEESRRIGQELHDGLAQTLSAVKVWGEAAVEQVDQGSRVEVLNSLENIVSMAREAVEEVRRISLNLRPSLLDDLGLLPAISWLCNNFEVTHSGIGIEKQIDIQENDIPERLKIIIFRIAQEALNNIGKHSQASLVHFSLRKKIDGNRMELSVTDNGTGFDMDHVESGSFARGLGLDGMKERTELSGGSFSIESTKRKGTTVRALWEC